MPGQLLRLVDGEQAVRESRRGSDVPFYIEIL